MSINNATPQDWNNIRDKEFKHRDTITETPKETWNRYVEAAMSEAHEEDVVNKPAHYNAGGVECIEAIRASMSVEAFGTCPLSMRPLCSVLAPNGLRHWCAGVGEKKHQLHIVRQHLAYPHVLAVLREVPEPALSFK